MTKQQSTHVPVYEFDYYRDPHVQADAHQGYMRLKREAPPLFWTNHNDGHWVANSADLVMEVLRQPEIFSSQFLSIPINPKLPKMIPQMIDPPGHRFYQKMLRPFFELRAIDRISSRILTSAEQCIDTFAKQGKCEFVGDVGSHFSLTVFMELVGFPLDKFDLFRELEVAFFSEATDRAVQAQVSGQIVQLLAELIEERRKKPKNDWITVMVHDEFEGRNLSQLELVSIGFQMFIAGLDTISTALSFGMRHLANDKELRQRIIDNPECIPDAVEELMRRYTFISLPRYVTQDVELSGIKLSEGEAILAPLAMVGWDIPDPDIVSLDRPACKHAAWGSGIHMCPAIHLARREMTIFYGKWLERIGHFHQVETEKKPMRIGTVQSLCELHLAWDVN
jgi:cytochrome P450